MASNVNAQLGLVITAEDQASRIFEEMATRFREAFSSIVSENNELSEVFESVARAASSSAETIAGANKEEQEAVFMTRQELLDFARQTGETYDQAKQDANAWADVTTAYLREVYEAHNNARVVITEDLTGIADATDGSVIKSQREWANVVSMSGKEIIDTVRGIAESEENLGNVEDMIKNKNYSMLSKMIEDFTQYTVVLDKAKTAEEERAAAASTSVSVEEKVGASLSNIETRYKDVMAAVTASDKAQAEWRNTTVMSTDEVRTAFDAVIQKYEGLDKIAGLSATDQYNDMKKVIEAFENLDVIIDKTADKEANLGNSSKDSSQELEQNTMKTAAAFQDVGTRLNEVGTRSTEFFKNAVEKGAEFDQQVHAISATLNSRLTGEAKLSTEAIQALNDKALQMGQTGYFSANQVAEGMYTLARQGLTYKDIMGGAMQSVQDLAVATDSNLTETANVVSDIVHEMGDEMKKEFGPDLQTQYTKTANMISGAMHNSRLSMADFLNTMKYVGPAASEMGLGVTDASEAIALLGEHGIKGSQAGTNLKTMLTSLIAPTKGGAEALKELGLITEDGGNAFLDSTGHMVSFEQIQSKLHDTIGKLSPAMQLQAEKAIFGKYAMTGMALVSSESSEKMKELAHDVTSASSAQDLAAAKWNNSAGDLRRLTAGYETLVKEIGVDLIPIALKLVDVAQSVMHWFDSLSPSTQKLVVEVAAFGGVTALVSGKLMSFAASFLYLKMSMEGMSSLGPMIAGFFGKTAVAAETTTVAVEGAAAAEVAAGGAAGGLGAALTVLTGPVGIIIASVTTLGYLFYQAYQHCDGFRDSVNKIGGVFASAAQFVKSNLFGKDIVADVTAASNKTVGTVVKMANDVEVKLVELKDGTKGIAADTAAAVIDASNKMRDMSVKAADDRLKKETEDATFLKDNLKSITQEQYTSMMATAQKQHDDTIKSAQDINQKVTAEITKLKDNGVTVTEDMKTQIIKKFQDQRDGTIKAVSDTQVQYDTIMNKLKASSGKITADVASQSIKDANNARDGQVKAANDTYDKTIAAITRMKDDGTIKTQQQADAMLLAAGRQRDGSIQAAETMRSDVVTKIKSMAGDSMKYVDDADGHMLSGWQAALNGMSSWTDSVIGSIKKAFSGLSSFVSSVFSEISRESAAASANSNFHIPGHAKGTDNFEGGLTWINEEGPELVNLPSGTQIIPHDKSMKMIQDSVSLGKSNIGGGSTHKQQVNNITINVNGTGGRNMGDFAQDLAKQVRLQVSAISL